MANNLKQINSKISRINAYITATLPIVCCLSHTCDCAASARGDSIPRCVRVECRCVGAVVFTIYYIAHYVKTYDER